MRELAQPTFTKSWMSQLSFVALDFETANRGFDSACAVGLVIVEQGRIVARETAKIRPSSSSFDFTHIHGLGWDDVCTAPGFRDVWSKLSPLLEGVSFVAAHHAVFDRAVLRACCRRARIQFPRIPFRCTVAIARQVWKVRRASLPDVCRFLGIPLSHHDPLSDAEACARIVIAAMESGWLPERRVQ